MVDIIKSRDGRIVECNPLKITSAIGKAGEEIWEFGGWEAEEPTLWVLTSIHELHFGPIPNVVEIQEIVERLFHHSPLWGIYEYLQPEYHQSIVWEGGEPPKYRYKYPEGINKNLLRTVIESL